MNRFLDPYGVLAPVWRHVVLAILFGLVPLFVCEAGLVWHWKSLFENPLGIVSLYPVAAQMDQVRKQLGLGLRVRRWLGWTNVGMVASAAALILLAISELRAHGVPTERIKYAFPVILYLALVAWIPLASRIIHAEQQGEGEIV